MLHEIKTNFKLARNNNLCRSRARLQIVIQLHARGSFLVFVQVKIGATILKRFRLSRKFLNFVSLREKRQSTHNSKIIVFPCKITFAHKWYRRFEQ